MQAQYDRRTEDVGNIVKLEHVNVTVPDQQIATLFYVLGLGFTRDPYMMVELDNMWINIGRNQMHLPSGPAQRLRGVIGLVVPDLALLRTRLQRVQARLAGTAFQWREADDGIDITCPWGNRFRAHAAAPHFGDAELGMPYIEFDVAPGAAAPIADFYRDMLGAQVTTAQRAGAPSAAVCAGPAQWLHFRETDAQQPGYDGHHIQIYIGDFSGPHRRLLERGLISRETDAHEWRFVKVVDMNTGATLFEVEHEVRSLRHPLYGRPLVNRNTAQTNRNYLRGQDAFPGRS